MTSSTIAASPRSGGESASSTPSRVLVTWQHPRTRSYHAVGFLDCDSRGYEFAYLDRISEIPEFNGLLGFPDVHRRYRSPHLFPLFAERVLDPGRSDGPQLMDALNLDMTAGPMEVLARSGGRRNGDAIETVPVPRVEQDWSTNCTFLVHGVRHAPGALEHLDILRPGDQLRLVAQPENQHNARALLVTHDDHPLGWAPDPLVDYLHAARSAGTSRVVVVRANPPEYGHHLRLLVRFEGRVPVGFTPMAGAEWAVLPE